MRKRLIMVSGQAQSACIDSSVQFLLCYRVINPLQQLQ